MPRLSTRTLYFLHMSDFSHKNVNAETIIFKRWKAENENFTDTVEFRVGDAYDLPFEDNTFDVVITQFVSQFFDMETLQKTG